MDETRVTDPSTGGQKGQKPQRPSMLPPRALLTVSEVYRFGAGKYDRDNWRRGYAWSLSFDALQRHLLAFWDGEDIDPESGLPHLAHAAFHVLTLLTFMEEHREGDDRFRRPARIVHDETGVTVEFDRSEVDRVLEHVRTIEHRHDAGLE